MIMRRPIFKVEWTVQEGIMEQAEENKLPTCSGYSLNCMNRVLGKVGAFKTISATGQVCMPACEDQVYHMELTSSAFPNRATFPKRDEQCLLIIKLRVD